MLRLVRKNSFMFLTYQGLYYAFLMPMINSDRLTGPKPLDPGFTLFLATYVFWLVLGAAWGHEQMEYKSSGYLFLRILPVPFKDIVLSKYIMVFFSVGLYVAVHYIWFGTIFSDPTVLVGCRNNLVIAGNVCLVVTGLIYIGVFRYGFKKFGNVMLITWLAILIIPIPVKILVLKRAGIRDADIILSMANLNVMLFTAAGIVLFGLTFYLAVKQNSRISE